MAMVKGDLLDVLVVRFPQGTKLVLGRLLGLANIHAILLCYLALVVLVVVELVLLAMLVRVVNLLAILVSALVQKTGYATEMRYDD